MDVAFWHFSNNTSNYDSVDDSMTLIMIMYYACNGLFPWVIYVIGVLNFGWRKKYPTALLRASSYEM